MSAVLIPTGSEAEWLDARRKGITASEIATVMGLSPASQSSPYALYHRKRGDLPEIGDNDAMERGRVLEPYIARKFAERRPEFAVMGDGRALFAHPDRPWQLATPDRFAYEPEGYPGDWNRLVAVLETKSDASPGDEWGEDGSDEIPVHYRCQVLWQMDVMGVTAAFLACLFIQPWKVRVYELTMDGRAVTDLKLMREEARDFLDRIDLGDPPDIDWRPATAAALKHLHPEVDEDRDVLVGRQLAISYRAALRRYSEAGRRKDEMSNRLLAAMGTAKGAVDPATFETIASRSVSYPKRVSAALLRERHPAIAAECTPDPKPVIKLTPARAKKGKTS